MLSAIVCNFVYLSSINLKQERVTRLCEALKGTSYYICFTWFKHVVRVDIDRIPLADHNRITPFLAMNKR